MKTLIAYLCAAFGLVILIPTATGQTYQVPPSSSTRSNVPYISDEAMKQCVISYNKAKWLADEINVAYVD